LTPADELIAPADESVAIGNVALSRRRSFGSRHFSVLENTRAVNMLQIRIQRAFLFAAVCITATLGVAGSAQAVVYTGHWDPAYGPSFPSLGWEGDASFFIPNACLAGSGWIANTDPCAAGAMKVLSADVDFYNAADPSRAAVETLTFDPNVLVYKMFVAGHQLQAVSTDFLGPVQGFASIAGGGADYFDLKFLELETENVQLFQTVGHTDPICAFTGTPAGCGFSATRPTLVLIPVPEPNIAALMLGGLAFGWMARRRRR
jgi:hypothetical protein